MRPGLLVLYTTLGLLLLAAVFSWMSWREFRRAEAAAQWSAESYQAGAGFRAAQYQANRLGLTAIGAVSLSFFFLLGAVLQMKRHSRQEQEAHIQNERTREPPQSPLQASEQRYRMLFENNPQPMWIFDVETLDFLDVNEAAILHYGYTRDEFLAMNLRDLRPTAEEIKELLDDVAQHKSRHRDGPWRHRNKHGVIFDVEITAVPIFFEQRPAKFVLISDVTSQYAAEEALRRSEERYRVIVETASDAIVTIDERSKIVFANQPLRKIFGYQPEELIGKPLAVLMPDSLQVAPPAGFQRLFDSNQRGSSLDLFELAGLHRDGSEIPLEVSFGEFRSGSQRWFTGVLRDVSERRRAQEHLKQAKDLIETVFHTVPLAIWGIDLQGNVTFWNPAAESMFGWSASEVFGRPLPTIPEQQQPEFQDWLSGYQRGHSLSGLERRRRRKDGSEIDCTLWTASLRSVKGDIVGTVGIVADNSQRKRYETSLRESEEKFRKLFAGNPQPMWVFDQQTLRFLEVNEAAVRHYGYSQAEFLSMTLAQIRPAEDVPAFLRAVHSFESAWHHEWRHITKDGRTINVEISSHKVDLFGQSAILSLVQDITERKKAEQEMGRYVQQLARSNSDLQQFAFAASHDLLEPIRMVTTQTQLFERHFGEQVPPQGREYLRFAREGALRMRLLVDALREYWEIQRRILDLQPIFLLDVVQETISQLSSALQEANATATWEELPSVQGDKTLLLTLFWHLIDNALKFRSGDAPLIHFSAQRTDLYWVISIRDNGIGMERQYTERVFQIFHRLSREGAGIGIGLSLCKQIMDRHEGRIWIDSQPNLGTTVHVQFPGAFTGTEFR